MEDSEGMRYPGTVVTGCELPLQVLGPDLGPLQDQFCFVKF